MSLVPVVAALWWVGMDAQSAFETTQPEQKVGKNRVHLDLVGGDLDAALERVSSLVGVWETGRSGRDSYGTPALIPKATSLTSCKRNRHSPHRVPIVELCALSQPVARRYWAGLTPWSRLNAVLSANGLP